MTWNLHQALDKKGVPIPNAWDYCDDSTCTQPHTTYAPFRKITGLFQQIPST